MNKAQLNFLTVLQPDAAEYIVEQTRNCPMTLALLSYINHRLRSAEREDMEAHLFGCDACRGLMIEYVRNERSDMNIEATAKSYLHNNLNEELLRPGDQILITKIHCHDGPYTYTRLRDGQQKTVPRLLLVECGALEPLGQAGNGRRVRIIPPHSSQPDDEAVDRAIDARRDRP